MLNVLLDLVVCGGAMCGNSCGRLTKSLQEDDADLWKDLTLQNSVSSPKSPTVPSVVEFPSDSDDCDGDDISTLYDPHNRQYDGLAPETASGELEFKVEIVEQGIAHAASHGYSILNQTNPSRRFQRDDGDCDGSSYSSCRKLAPSRTRLRKHTLTWQTNSTDSTMQTQNYSLRSLKLAH